MGPRSKPVKSLFWLRVLDWSVILGMVGILLALVWLLLG